MLLWLQVSTALIFYGAIEIPCKILHGFLANQRLVSALFHLGVALICAACSMLLLVSWAKKEALYVSLFFFG